MGQFPTQFGPYELVRRLGAGGMAETFVAIRRGPGGFEQTVCLKRILPAYEKDTELVRLFLEEARLSAKLRHANIAQVLDFGVVSGSHFLTLELVTGLDLGALLSALRQAGQSLPDPISAYVALELATALDAAHMVDASGVTRGIVHRDISPSNVLLSKAGEVKLTDFGIGKAMTQPGPTRTGMVKGKAPYMAPEYARTGQYDARSDLFSLGVVLYECMAGERPFVGLTDLDTMERVQRGEHVRLDERAPTAPPSLTGTIERLLAPDPEERFPSARALIDALLEAAPPPTARRELGELVAHLAVPPPDADSVREALPFAPTQRVSPATAVLAPAAEPPPPSLREVRPAHPEAKTGILRPESAPTGRGAVGAAGAEPARDERDTAKERPAVKSRPTTPRPETAPPPEPPAAASVPPRRAGRLAMVLLGATLLGAVTWTALPRDSQTGPASPSNPSTSDPDPESEPESESESVPVPEAEPVPDPVPDPVPESVPDPDPDPVPESVSEPALPSTGRATSDTPSATILHVVVVPYGRVWIDGEEAGPSPVRMRVRPGAHAVATGETGPSLRKTVRVQAGETRRVVLTP